MGQFLQEIRIPVITDNPDGQTGKYGLPRKIQLPQLRLRFLPRTSAVNIQHIPDNITQLCASAEILIITVQIDGRSNSVFNAADQNSSPRNSVVSCICDRAGLIASAQLPQHPL